MTPLPRPNLEKRILPLLDVSLSLVGVLILMVGVSNEQPTSGIDGQIVRLLAELDGDVLLDDRVLASNTGGVNPQEMARLKESLSVIDSPLVLLYYPSPRKVGSQVDATLISAVLNELATAGYTVRTVELSASNGGP